MEAVKRENALRSGNSGKASAKKRCKKSITRKNASVNEIVGGLMWVFGFVALFGRWDAHAAQMAGSIIAAVLLVAGTAVMLGGKE